MVTGSRRGHLLGVPQGLPEPPSGYPQQPSNVALVPQNLNLNVVKKSPALHEEGFMHWL